MITLLLAEVLHARRGLSRVGDMPHASRNDMRNAPDGQVREGEMDIEIRRPPTSISRFGDSVLRSSFGGLDGCCRVYHDGNASVGFGNGRVCGIDLGNGGLRLAHGALRMNATTRIHGLMTNRATETRGNRGMEVLGIHPVSSGGKRRGMTGASRSVEARGGSAPGKTAIHAVPSPGTACLCAVRRVIGKGDRDPSDQYRLPPPPPPP
jgi:hypothetical protein